jgi:hypothetical protein
LPGQTPAVELKTEADRRVPVSWPVTLVWGIRQSSIVLRLRGPPPRLSVLMMFCSPCW